MNLTTAICSDLQLMDDRGHQKKSDSKNDFTAIKHLGVGFLMLLKLSLLCVPRLHLLDK